MNVKYKALYLPLLVVFVFVLLSITYRKLYFIHGLLENREKDETCGFKAQLQTPNTSHRQAPMLPDIYLIPDDNTLNEKNDLQLLEIYLKYVNTIQAHCRNVIRVGSMTDGGKEICVDGQYRPKAPCLIYSFGIQNNWSFDNMAADLFGCEIHCFDPSINKTTSRISENIWFYNIGLGGINTLDSRKWDVRTLQKIKEDLKHNNRTIDILKIDIEADEWTAIPEMLQSGVLDSVNQIAIEIHYKHGKVPAKTQLSILRRLYEAGFRIVMRDRNIRQVKSHPAYKYGVIILYELTLVNWIE